MSAAFAPVGPRQPPRAKGAPGPDDWGSARPPDPLCPSLAVYIHWPWCAAICPYCDFVKQAADFRLADQYIDAVARHLDAAPRRPVHSVYLGGGTPSLLRPDRLRGILEACRARLQVQPDAEISLEANPSDVVAHKVEAYLQAGVNRISLGVQSLQDAELRLLGRRHDAARAVRAFGEARAAGCRNLSVDLMYGLPGQTIGQLARSVEGVIELEPEHISCYALTVEEGTPLAADVGAGRLQLPDDDAVADQYAFLQATLARSGYRQYEVSNWARPGFESVHNLTYWRNGEYVGLGAGAAGSVEGMRYTRVADVRAYIALALAGEAAYAEAAPWTREQRMRDTVMLGLRLAEGVSDRAFRAQFGLGLGEYCSDRLGSLVRAGILGWEGDRLALNPAYYFVSTAVLAEVLPGG